MSPKRKKPTRWKVLTGIVFLEICLIGLLNFSHPPVSHAFLIKQGATYTVFWPAEGRYESASYPDLGRAVDFARNTLHLVEGFSTTGLANMETLWLRDRFGAFTLMWKTFKHDHLNHLTFKSELEARYFEEAFKGGAYSPSPFGHSILLLPPTHL